MRIMVFFDLPVNTASNRREATRFRNFLLKDGYHMLQYSVYIRICNGVDSVDMHRRRLKGNLPKNGSVRLLVITERQFESVEVLVGPRTKAEEPFEGEQLSLF